MAFVVEGGSSSGGEQSIVLLRVAVDDVASSWSTNYGNSGKMTQNIKVFPQITYFYLILELVDSATGDGGGLLFVGLFFVVPSTRYCL